jgi:hypothetical protein
LLRAAGLADSRCRLLAMVRYARSAAMPHACHCRSGTSLGNYPLCLGGSAWSRPYCDDH